MTTYQEEKKLVLEYYKQIENASPDDVPSVIDQFVSSDYLWRGYHPFHEIHSGTDVGERFWAPLKNALTSMQRRMDVFIAGKNQIDDYQSTWVVSMGHLMGLFDTPWLGIQPTNKIAMLRYCEFNKVENGKITETAMFFDIPHLMVQAGQNPFGKQTAAELVQPGPMTHTALCYQDRPEEEGQKTLKAINDMVEALGNWNNKLSLIDELRLGWHEDMIWWGPTGIGATYTIERYAEQHSGPFRATLKDRVFNGHICKLAEGEFGGFFGWPNLSVEPTGGFMGMPATGKRGDMRVIDVYRRRGDKLVENWIFIDLLHFWNMQGYDFLNDGPSIIPA